jgi:hypothetical protein
LISFIYISLKYYSFLASILYLSFNSFYSLREFKQKPPLFDKNSNAKISKLIIETETDHKPR